MALPSSIETERNQYLMGLVRNASEPIIDWPAPNRDDVVLIGKIVMLYRRVGDRRPARSGPQEDHMGLGGAVAVRPQGCSQAARLPMVRRKRWPATIMVHRRRGDQLGNEIAFLKTEIYLSEVEPRLQTLTALSRFSVRGVDRENSRSTSPLMARTSALRRNHYRHTADEEAS